MGKTIAELLQCPVECIEVTKVVREDVAYIESSGDVTRLTDECEWHNVRDVCVVEDTRMEHVTDEGIGGVEMAGLGTA